MPMRGENWRFWLPVVLLAAFAVYTGQKLVRAHVDREISVPNYFFTRDLPGRRGGIYDSTGTYALAMSVPVWEYRLDPVELTNGVVRRPGEPVRPHKAIVKTISDTLGIDYQTLLGMSRNVKNRYQYLSLSSNIDAHRTLADSTLVRGVAIEDRQIRQYFNGRRLCHVLGAVNVDGVGLAGIELKYNSYLTGVPGKIHGMVDGSRSRRELYDKRIVSSQPVPGADIYLTIDHNVQYEAESALDWGIKEFGAGSGWCIVMDSKTGAVLALASSPTYEPARFGRSSDAMKINRAVNYTYEPGSVMKPITAAAAIDLGIATPETMYSSDRYDRRYFKLPGDSHGWDPQISVRKAIVKSSNIVIGKLGVDIGPRRLWEYMKKFGFGERTGIELPGEEKGQFPHWKVWDKVKWSRAPIGQGVSVTAIQLASAYQAIANDGLRMQPRIVRKVVGADGKVLIDNTPKPLDRPISAKTARIMRDVMKDVATHKGTARRAAIRGYTTAGKTGTAQKVVNGTYSQTLYVATFCGIIPADDPRLVILVSLDFDRPAECHQGGNSSAPVYRRIASAATRYLMIPADKPEEFVDFDDEDEYDRAIDERISKQEGPVGD